MNSAKVTLVLGGARSGKSGFAQRLAEDCDGASESNKASESNRDLVYIATAQAFDAEMTERITRHQSDRGPRWQTIECPMDLSAAIAMHRGDERTILIDCLTLWLSNLMLGDHDILAATSNLTSSLKDYSGRIILVSNEVGQGIVPNNALARRFRDEAGRLNQAIARAADGVWFVTAGLAQKLKG